MLQEQASPTTCRPSMVQPKIHHQVESNTIRQNRVAQNARRTHRISRNGHHCKNGKRVLRFDLREPDIGVQNRDREMFGCDIGALELFQINVLGLEIGVQERLDDRCRRTA